MPTTPVQPIIVRKKKVMHGGHHSGAWKVAYADFVTAMMALFIVLWLLSSSEQVQKAVGGYFADPNGKGKDVGNGLRGSGGESLSLAKDDMNKLKERLEKAVLDVSAFKKIKENVRITVTGEGLRVELMEGKESTFFESGSPKPTEFGREILALLATQIASLPNKVTLEGHTDAKPFPSSEYSNWELSSDRANAARRWMMQSGLRGDQVTQVRGFADQSLRLPKDPENPSNRRVTLLINYAPASADDGKEGKHGEEAGAKDNRAGKAESKAESKAGEDKPGQKGGPKAEETGRSKPGKSETKPEGVKVAALSKLESYAWMPKFIADRLPGHAAEAQEAAKK